MIDGEMRRGFCRARQHLVRSVRSVSYNMAKLIRNDRMRESWLQRPQSNTAIVFVHGIFSSSAKCWTHKNGVCWPEMVRTSPTLSHLGVYLFEYKTGAFAGSYGLPDAVDSLKEHWKLDGLDLLTNVIFVCHSMGGIVTRKFLLDNAVNLQGKRIGIFLLGSPTLGSKLATGLAPLARFFGNEQAAILSYVKNNPWLKDLHKGFKNLKEAGTLDIQGKELIEDKPSFWSGKKIVQDHSAAVYFGDPYKVPDADHSGISKPSSDRAVQHRMLEQFVSQFAPLNFKYSETLPLVAKNNTQETTSPKSLFDVYAPNCRDFYYLRSVDINFTTAFTTNSVWLHGPSGVGKTSIVKRYIDIEGKRPIEISLSLLGRSATPQSVLREIVETLRGRYGISNPALATNSEAVDLVCRAESGSTFVLFIDEVPVNANGNADSVLETVAGLLDGAKRRGRIETKFVVCSISEPSTTGNGRFLEQFSVLRVLPWEYADLIGLAKIIKTDIPTLNLTDTDVADITSQANGSPRFMKTAFRHLHRMPEDRALSVSGAIELTQDSLKGF